MLLILLPKMVTDSGEILTSILAIHLILFLLVTILHLIIIFSDHCNLFEMFRNDNDCEGDGISIEFYQQIDKQIRLNKQ